MPPSTASAQGSDPYARLRPLFQFQQPRSAPPQRRPARSLQRKSTLPQRAAPARKFVAAPARAKPKAKPSGRPRRAAAPLALQRHGKPAAAELPAKASDAKLVLVAGDFFGQALAEGLAEAFREEPLVRIENAARSRAGLLQDDAAALLPQPEGTRPAAIVIMLGGNDRRSVDAKHGRIPLRSPDWNSAYEARAAAVVAAAESRNIPLVWVGLPSVGSGKASADLLAFNELYRTATEAGSGVFVDTWDGFVNEAGVFVSFGPGIDGQKARLRTKDGIGFTRAGRRKLAFFVQKPLAKLLDLPLSPDLPNSAELPSGDAGPGRTEPMELSGHSLRAGEKTELLGDATGAAPALPDADRALFDPPAVPGRADNFLAASGGAAQPDAP